MIVARSLELADGLTLPCVERGDATGLPLVLLHGVTDSWRSFEPVLPCLPASIRAIALTQRGHGDATRPAAGYGARHFAGDVAAALDTLGIARAVIVGHSMGGTNAQRFAIDHPDRTLGLVLAGTFASYRENAAALELWQTAVSRLTDPVDPAFVREFQESTLAQPVSPEFLELVVAESLKVPARVWRAAFEGFLEDPCAADLPRITAPTLILWGTRDAICTRRDQEALLKAIAGSRLTVYEGAGHALHWEEPARFAADVAAFASSLR